MKRTLAFLLTCSLLTACGGGGGNNPNPGPPPHNPPSTQTQAAYGAVALQVLKVGNSLASGFGGSHSSVLASIARRGAMGLHVVGKGKTSSPFLRTTPTPPPLGACTNKARYATQTAPDNSYTDIWLWTYYDADCTSSYMQSYYRETVTTQTPQFEVLHFDGNQAFFTQSQVQTSFNNSVVDLQQSQGGIIMPQQFTQSLDTALSNQGAYFSHTGISCGYNGGSISTCGFGAVNDVSPSGGSVGATVTLSSYTQTSTPEGGVQYTIAGTVGAFTGEYQGLTLGQGTFPNWSVSGGTQVSSLNLNSQYDFDGGGLANGGSVSATDTAHGVVVSVSIGTDGTMTGSLKFTDGASIANFNLNVLGDGTITFANGSTGTVVGFGLSG